MKKASMLLFARDKAPYVARALKSCFAQTYENLEIVVGDQGSTDGTRQILHKLISEYKGPHSIKFFDFPDTSYKGFIGMNRHLDFLMSQSTGDYCFVQCGDDWSLPECVATQVEVFEKTGAAMVAGKMQFEEKGEIIGVTGSDFEGWLDMKQIVEDKQASSCHTNWTREFWYKVAPIPELFGPDIWLPPIACLLGGVYMHQKVVYTYTRTADTNNTGLEGVLRGLQGDPKQIAALEVGQYQLAYAMQQLLEWLAKKGLGDEQQLEVVYKEMMMRLVSMFECRKQCIYKRIDTYRMAA